MPEVHKQVRIDGARSLAITLGSIVDEDVEGIVNAANAHLEHGGGVAAVIARGGGEALRRESREHVREEGPVPVGESVITTAGNLPHRGVVHAVGPRQGEGREEEKLGSAVESSLQRANEEGWTSLALPAISAGIFGVPPKTCAAAYVRGIRDHFRSHPDSSVVDVRICLFDPEPELLSAVESALEKGL